MSQAALATPSVLVSSPPSSTPVPPPPVEPGVTFIVPNIAGLALIDDTLYPSGSRARVMTLLDDFDLLKTSTLTLTPLLVVATASGVGRWVRRLQGNAEAWLAQTEWRIDAATGNDENAGRNASPLATWAEMMRRWGGSAGQVHHTVNKTVRVTSIGAADPMDFDFTTDPTVLVNITGDLSAPVFAGVISAKTDLSDVAPGTASANTSTWNAAQGGRLTRDVTNNRWCFPEFDLGGGNLECGPWTNIDTALGSTTVTTGNTTVGAAIETYTLPIVAATSNLSISNVRSNQFVNLVVQNLEFTGQRTTFRGSKFVAQNCRINSVRFCSGPVVMNNCYSNNGSPFDTSEVGQIIANSGVWASSIADNACAPSCLIDVRSNILFAAAQVLVNRKGVFRLRNMFSMRMGTTVNILLLDGALAYLSTSTLCGTGNTGFNFTCSGTSGVQIKGGTAASQCRLTGNAVAQVAFGANTTCNAFDRATGLYTLPRNLTYALIDATVAALGFGGGALDPQFGTFFQVL